MILLARAGFLVAFPSYWCSHFSLPLLVFVAWLSPILELLLAFGGRGWEGFHFLWWVWLCCAWSFVFVCVVRFWLGGPERFLCPFLFSFSLANDWLR